CVRKVISKLLKRDKRRSISILELFEEGFGNELSKKRLLKGLVCLVFEVWVGVDVV
ncbi:4714_t:CDS:1, partial [Dentiscutata heterogama]